MDFEEVCTFFGGGIFPEEFRGNLAELSYKLDHIKTNPDPRAANANAATALLRAIWHSLSANPSRAFPLILQLIAQDNLPQRWQFRAHAYRILLTSWLEQPPCFRFCSLSGSPAKLTSENGESGDYVALVVGESMDLCEQLMQDVSRLDVAEYYLFVGIHWLPAALDIARELHPTLGREGAVASDLGVELLDQTRKALQTAQRLLDVSGMLSASAYADSLLYQLSYSQGLADDHFYLNRMRVRYMRAGDHHGLGLCAIMHGDRSCSTTHTSPTFLNVNIRDDWDDCGGDSSQHNPLSSAKSVLEHLEETMSVGKHLKPLTEELCFPMSYQKPSTAGMTVPVITNGLGKSLERSVVQAAFQHYEVAITCFEKVGSARGVAAALLRTGCLRQILMMTIRYIWTPEEVERSFELFLRAESLFIAWGDTWNQKLARTHRISLFARTSDRLALGTNIGRWGKETGNDEHTLHFGLLALRLARHARYVRGQIHEARHHVHVALAIFDAGTRRSSAMLQSLTLEIDCLASLGDHQSALLKLDDLKGLLLNVMALFFEDLEAHGDKMPEDVHGLQRRICAHQHSAKRACELAISIVPEYTKNIYGMDNVIIDLMGKVKELDFTEFTKASTAIWVSQQEERLRFVRASIAIDKTESSAKSSGDNSSSALEEALCVTNESTTLTRLYSVNLKARMGQIDAAAEILISVEDDVRLPIDLPEDLVSKQYLFHKEILGQELLLDACIQVKNWQRGRSILDVLEKLSPGYFTTVSSYTRTPPWHRCLWAGLVMEGIDRHDLAIRFLIQGKELFSLSQALRQTMSGTGERLVQLRTGGVRLINAYIRVLLRLRDKRTYESDLQPLSHCRVDLIVFKAFAQPLLYLTGDPEVDALVALETERMGLFNELESSPSDMDRAQLIRDQYHIQLLLDLKSLPRSRDRDEDIELERLESGKVDAQNRLQRASVMRDWSRRPRPDQVIKLIIESEYLDKVLVMHTSVDEDGMALVGIGGKGIEHASFDLTANTRVIRQLVDNCLDEFAFSEGRESWKGSLEPLGLLSAAILGPLEEAVAAAEHVIFISSGDLARFPFGTLLYKSTHLIMTKGVSQTPSLYGLLDLMTRETNKSALGRFCAVAKPGSLRESTRTGEKQLPMAGVEVILLANLFGTEPRNAAHMTREDFMHEFETCDWLHLGTHGSVDLESPFHSSLSLEEKLRVLDLLVVQSAVRVVVFSACFSGLGKSTDRGDILGFSHAVLAAGANAYIGALWHSNDLATLAHMSYFYHELLFHEDHASIATLWHRATTSLISLDLENNRGIIGMIDDFINGWDTAEDAGLEPGKFVKFGRQKLQHLKEELSNWEHIMDFKHPFYWAPFIIMGNAEQYYTLERIDDAIPGCDHDERGENS